MPTLKDEFRDILSALEDNDLNYGVRYHLVLRAMSLASQLGMPVGIRIDENEPEWPVVYIELPTGQVSWHMPQHPVGWDGHTTEMKFQRIRDWLKL